MDPVHFTCPFCTAKLRVRDRIFIGRQVPCPECGGVLTVVQGASGFLVEKTPPEKIEKPAASAPAGIPPGEKAPGSPRKTAGMAPPDSRDNPGTGKKSASSKNIPSAVQSGASVTTKSVPVPAGKPSALDQLAAGKKVESTEGFNPQHAPSPRRSLGQRLADNSREVAWGLTGSLLLLVVGLAYLGRGKPPESSSQPDGAAPPAQEVASTEKLRDTRPPAISTGIVTPTEKPSDPTVNVNPEKNPTSENSEKTEKIKLPSTAQSLQGLYRSLEAFEVRQGHFPAGTRVQVSLPVESRFSWQAALVTLADPQLANSVQWDLGWQNPANEAFVRKRRLEFQNPSLLKLTGEDGYPAAHFVGMAGVGSDAPQLPKTDRRAGVFGFDRTMREEDIRDGLANTLLVMGVQQHLGSWAAGGAPTVRGFTREPYVNGPDGFGTGQAETMFALMADGSVRTLSQRMEPGLLRRLAAAADGFPLDLTVAGEPGDNPPEMSDPLVAEKPGIEKPVNPMGKPELPLNPEKLLPLLPENTTEKKPNPKPPVKQRTPADIAEALKQPLAGFEIPRSTPLADVLDDLSELVGVPIETSSAGPGLKRGVTTRLGRCTIKEVLEKVLDQAALEFRIEDDHLRVVPREAKHGAG